MLVSVIQVERKTFEGLYFCTDIDDCLKHPCRNGGTCVNLKGTGYACTCDEGYSGPNCDQGMCVHADKQWHCRFRHVIFICSTLWRLQGETLFSDIDDCSSSPCQNGGSCMNEQGPGYTCSCVEGYSGRKCDKGMVFEVHTSVIG